MERDGKLKCEGCDLVLAERYGPDAVNYIECHHLQWLSKTGPTTTDPKDLALLCPNCHKVTHLAELRTVDDLRN